MALDALVENMQREGLNDADKGEGIAQYLKMCEKSHNSTRAELVDNVGSLLGLGKTRVYELLQVSELDADSKEPIRQQKIAGRAALIADRLGGASAVKAAAEKGLSCRAVEAIQSEVAALPEDAEQDRTVKQKVRESFARGEIATAEQARTKARQLVGAQQAKEWRNEKPDLIVVIRGWTYRAEQWSKQMDEVIPYKEYIDQDPKVAQRFRAAMAALMEKYRALERTGDV
jgi:hypothetical protein